MIVPDVKPILNPYLAMTSEKYLKEVTVGPVSALSGKVVLEEYDAAWKGIFEEEKEKIGRALGRNGIVTEHVGSTSVPGLCAKPVIDILLIVRDSSDENAYVSQLERVGYTMRIREPEWFRHRMLKKHNPEVNLHVFSYGCSEAKRMLDFRDWLRTNEGDRMLYGNTKKALVQREWQYLQDYADAKSEVVREIFSHMECRTPQEKDACEIMPCVIRPWRTEDAEDIAYAMNNRNVLDNLRDGRQPARRDTFPLHSLGRIGIHVLSGKIRSGTDIFIRNRLQRQGGWKYLRNTAAGHPQQNCRSRLLHR